MKRNSTILKNNSELVLGDRVSIRVGHNFRGRLDPSSSGGVSVVQTKDINHDGSLDLANLLIVDRDSLKGEHFLGKDDILLRSRGGDSFPAVVVPSISIKVMAAFPILILRVKDNTILPQYLAWQLNQARVQNLLQGLAQSTFIPTLSKSALLGIPIRVPPLSVQSQIVSISQMVATESRLLKDISEKRQILASRLLLRYGEEIRPVSEWEELFRPLISAIQF